MYFKYFQKTNRRINADLVDVEDGQPVAKRTERERRDVADRDTVLDGQRPLVQYDDGRSAHHQQLGNHLRGGGGEVTP